MKQDSQARVESITNVKQRFSQLVNGVAQSQDPVVIDKQGLPSMAVVSMREYLAAKEANRNASTVNIADEFPELSPELAKRHQRLIDRVPVERRPLYLAVLRYSLALPEVSDEQLDRDIAKAVRVARRERRKG